MKKLSEQTRKLLRKIYLALGASAISMVFVACYGMPMDGMPPDCLEDDECSSYNFEEASSKEQDNNEE
ncbi:MAG: hypothetical protein LBU83_03095 [Bacteroidales bacterium]|jgi:hypothetical protein|nr:hypothetical protein [Bacteroidales bacterium]